LRLLDWGTVQRGGGGGGGEEQMVAVLHARQIRDLHKQPMINRNLIQYRYVRLTEKTKVAAPPSFLEDEPVTYIGKANQGTTRTRNYEGRW